MPELSELDLPTFDYLDPTLVGSRFHSVMNGLREQSWVAAVQPMGHVVLDRETVDLVLRTRDARMPAMEILELQGITSGPIHDQLSGNLLSLHGEAHRRQRALVQSAFTPRAADRLRPAMRAHLAALFDEAARDGACEFVSAIAKPYPARMIAEIVGAPASDADRLGEWAYWLQSTFDPTKIAGEPERIAQAAVEFDAYVRDLLAHPADSHGDDLRSVLVSARDAGTLSDEECVSLVGAVLIGGVDTTQAQLAHGVRLLADHPEQWAALVADPSLAPAAVDEILRYEPIAPFTARLVEREFTHRDVTFPAGGVLFACALTANHDPSIYADPDRFDLTVDRGSVKPLTFGAGPHFCLGAALARAELEEAVAFLAERVGALELSEPPTFDTAPGVYGLQRLPVRLPQAKLEVPAAGRPEAPGR